MGNSLALLYQAFVQRRGNIFFRIDRYDFLAISVCVRACAFNQVGIQSVRFLKTVSNARRRSLDRLKRSKYSGKGREGYRFFRMDRWRSSFDYSLPASKGVIPSPFPSFVSRSGKTVAINDVFSNSSLFVSLIAICNVNACFDYFDKVESDKI